jgi:hypothetical protein
LIERESCGEAAKKRRNPAKIAKEKALSRREIKS